MGMPRDKSRIFYTLVTIAMTNPVIQTDLAEVLGEIKQELKGIGERLGHLEVGQAELKAKADGIEKQFKVKVDGIEKEVTELKESVKEIKKSQTSQIWALIVAVFVAVIGLIGTLIVGFVKFFSFTNP